MSEVSISLNALAAKQQSIVGIPKGNMNQLRDLVTFVSEGKVSICILVGVMEWKYFMFAFMYITLHLDTSVSTRARTHTHTYMGMHMHACTIYCGEEK